MAGPNIDELLRQGVDAARNGDKLTARRLLQQVLLNDKNNVTALMWMASVVDTLEDRRAYLQRVLQVDPTNERAREALRRLGGPETPAAASPAARQSSPAVSNSGGSRTGLFVLAIVALVAVVMIALVLTTPDIIPSVAVQPSATSALPTATSAGSQVMPTLTVNALVVPFEERATIEPLPPTFTPLPTLEPTVAPTETPLPPSIDGYSFLSSDLTLGAAEESLRFFNGSTGATGPLGEGVGYGDVALSHDGSQIAFVRNVSPDTAEATAEAGAESESSARPQIFVAELSADLSTLSDIRQLTNVSATQILWPTFSADGEWIAFASNEDGDFDIYRTALFDGHVDKLTDNITHDTQPAFHPVEANLILYVSDVQSPGFTDLYLLDVNAISEPPVRLYNSAGNAYQPAWSSDAAQIAFISTANAYPDLFVINADGSRARQLTVDGGSFEDRAPAWTPDGIYIAFASNRESDNFQWYMVNAADSEISRLVIDDTSAGRLVFVP